MTSGAFNPLLNEAFRKLINVVQTNDMVYRSTARSILSQAYSVGTFHERLLECWVKKKKRRGKVEGLSGNGRVRKESPTHDIFQRTSFKLSIFQLSALVTPL